MIRRPGSKRTPIIQGLYITLFLLMSACSGGSQAPFTPSPTLTRIPNSVHINAPPRQPMTSTTEPSVDALATPSLTFSPNLSVADLIDIIEVSDPQSRTYDPKSTAYAQFQDAIRQVAQIGSSNAIDIPSILSYAINFALPDPYFTAQALITLGPDAATNTLPTLIGNVQSQNSGVRLASTIILGTAGHSGACAVGHIGPLLWDPDPRVRSAAAWAISRITGENVGQTMGDISTNPLTFNSVPEDTPEGSIAGTARNWWNVQGSKVNWHPHYDICDP